MRAKQKAANAGGFGRLCRATETPSRENGLKTNCKACAGVLARGNMPVPCSIARLGLGGLRLDRRTIAAPLRGVFLWSVVCKSHGVIASRFCTGAPRGNPSGLLFPIEQSANPRGVAHHLGGWEGGSQNVSIGA